MARPQYGRHGGGDSAPANSFVTIRWRDKANIQSCLIVQLNENDKSRHNDADKAISISSWRRRRPVPGGGGRSRSVS